MWTPIPSDQQFLEDFVSPALAMHTKTGAILDKHGYLRRGAAPFRRSPGGHVEILHVTSQPECVLLSTVVTTTDIETGKTEQIVNIRLFVKENAVVSGGIIGRSPTGTMRRSRRAGL